jgi:hypothetical protein
MYKEAKTKMDSLISSIKTIHSKYITNPNYVYKSCQKKWIIIMKKLPHTLTNENRIQIYNRKFALYRGDSFIIELIFDKFNPTKTCDFLSEQIKRDYYVDFVPKEVVQVFGFDTNIDIIYAKGIHYYKSIEPAFYQGLEQCKIILNGIYMSWYNNGTKDSEYNYKDGKIDGLYTEWNAFGFKIKECTFKEGKIVGNYTKWNEKGEKIKSIEITDASSCLKLDIS